jgi:hypothetical protein
MRLKAEELIKENSSAPVPGTLNEIQIPGAESKTISL